MNEGKKRVSDKEPAARNARWKGSVRSETEEHVATFPHKNSKEHTKRMRRSWLCDSQGSSVPSEPICSLPSMLSIIWRCHDATCE
mmetsp:Transcript_38197/g.75035  ORF Transcript_38197/g.75035 Transcript_38197/m.75035 type:complete len:85 (-) Transcript_38197:6-260(-)